MTIKPQFFTDFNQNLQQLENRNIEGIQKPN